MARAKVLTMESDRLKRLKKESSNLSGFDKAIMDGLLVEYDALAGMVETLRDDVNRNGVMIATEKGAANNRHEVMAENPAFTAYQKAIGRLGDLAKKISDFAKRSEDTPDDDNDSDLIAWNNARK